MKPSPEANQKKPFLRLAAITTAALSLLNASCSKYPSHEAEMKVAIAKVAGAFGPGVKMLNPRAPLRAETKNFVFTLVREDPSDDGQSTLMIVQKGGTTMKAIAKVSAGGELLQGDLNTAKAGMLQLTAPAHTPVAIVSGR